jgi:hypothetical protein
MLTREQKVAGWLPIICWATTIAARLALGCAGFKKMVNE